LGEFTSDKTIVSEYIYREDREIIKIENDQTWFNAQKIPKLLPRYSVAQLLIPDPDIYPVRAEFNQIDTYFDEYIVQFHQKYNGNSRKTILKVPSVSSVSSYQIEVKNWQFT
jgi:hypothetical protein